MSQTAESCIEVKNFNFCEYLNYINYLICCDMQTHVHFNYLLDQQTLTKFRPLTIITSFRHLQRCRDCHNLGQHLGPLGLLYLTQLYTLALNTNIVPHNNNNLHTDPFNFSLHQGRPYFDISQTTFHTSRHNIVIKSTTLLTQHYTT